MKARLILLLIFFVACISMTKASYPQSDSFQGYEITDKGAWCWFADSRALHYENKAQEINATFIGYIDVEGAIKATQYNHHTGERSEILIRSCFQPDDHNNPTFLALSDGRIMIFYSRHTDEPCFYYRISKKPGDITTLGKEMKLNTQHNTTYPSPFILSDDPHHIYLCWRGINWHPTIARLTMPNSEDEVAFDWGPKQIVQSTAARPYAKYNTNGKDKIYLTYTTGHPDNEVVNYVYFNYIDITDFSLRDVTGKRLSFLDKEIHSVSATEVYVKKQREAVVDASPYRNWIWQVEMDKEENPIIAMVRITEDKKSHDYFHVQWTGERWRKTFLANAGGAFHQTPGLEACYSGGMAIDSKNPYVVYGSVPRKGKYGTMYEIVKYTIDKQNKVESRPITHHSQKNNVRPFVIPNASEDSLRLLWMHGDYYDWIVSEVRPQGYPTAIHSEKKMNIINANRDKNGIREEAFIPSLKWLGEKKTEDESIHFTTQTYAKAKTNDLTTFTIVLSPFMSGNEHGVLFSFDGLTCGVSGGLFSKPYLTVNKVMHQSGNVLGTSAIWKQSPRSTNGEWYLPTLYDSFSYVLTYAKGELRTYVNGLVDQYMEINQLTLKDLILGGFDGYLKEFFIYDRVLNQDEIKILSK